MEQVVFEITGLPSNWNETVELHINPARRGAKPFRYDMLLVAGPQIKDVRLRSHLHEMLDTYSVGYTRYAFDA